MPMAGRCLFLLRILSISALAEVTGSRGFHFESSGAWRSSRSDDPVALEAIVQGLSQTVVALQAKVEALENAAAQQATAVSFMVQFTEYHHHFSGNMDLLHFDNIISNLGNAYNVRTGHFVAPVSGTYSFSVNLLSDHAHNVWQNICIDLNDACVALTQLADAAAMSIVLQLTAGDTVAVRKGDGPGLSIYGINHTTFCGFLVRSIA